MRRLIQTIGLALTLPASAAEVLWLADGPPPEATWVPLAAEAGARRGPLDPAAVRGAALDPGEADTQAYETLARVLREVRAYETRLDGELVIFRDLERPIQGITLIRDTADRDQLFTALAYQGFAVHRFFADTLADDDRAADFRVELGGRVQVRPWVDAVALAPDRAATAYDIAEAPARVAFGTTRDQVRADALPGTLVLPPDLPDDASVVLDGAPAAPSDGTLKVVPGRHFVHAVVDGHLVGRWDVRVGPAGEAVLALPVPEQAWQMWVRALQAGTPTDPPGGVADAVRTLDGLWVATGRADRPTLIRLDEQGRAAGTEAMTRRAPPKRRGGVGWSVAVGLDGGWLYSGDFYTQSPDTAPRTEATVNAGVIGVDVHATAEVGIGRFGGGVDVVTPLGADQVARTGDTALRPRPYVYALAGVRWVHVHGGFLFPYHPAAGVTATIPVYRGLEVRGGVTAGFPTTWTRGDGSSYDTDWIVEATAGLAWRFGPEP